MGARMKAVIHTEQEGDGPPVALDSRAASHHAYDGEEWWTYDDERGAWVRSEPADLSAP
jgi:hypothetical protein